eukprot:scaffold150749_cov31-Tisochrysis_lutea.AAC.1
MAAAAHGTARCDYGLCDTLRVPMLGSSDSGAVRPHPGSGFSALVVHLVPHLIMPHARRGVNLRPVSKLVLRLTDCSPILRPILQTCSRLPPTPPLRSLRQW